MAEAHRASSFDDRATTWDVPEKIERAERVAEAILSRIEVTRSTRVIELGAGTGLLGLALADRVPGGPAELVLADASSGMLAVAADKIRDRRLRFARTAAFELGLDPPPAGSPFDLAISLLMLHHVESTGIALAAVRSVLRAGGRIALADLDAEDGSFHGPSAEGIHHHGFERPALIAAAAAAGFADASVATATELERDGRRYPVFLLTAVAS
ncbi:MAG TPA: methyltransferase domain-containing protein [Candidatus Limnocylindrales bacterium]|nr:methyltransferase domain-containing protein [Candidatus Limnocylindrales bacterium]